MLKKYFGLAAGLLLLAGCSNNDFTDNGATTPEGQMRTISSINATMDNADTRVQLKNGNQLIWNEDDVINVFSDEGSYHNYTLTSGAGTTSATFAGDEITGNQFYALFCNTIFNLDRENDEVSMYWDSDAIFGKDGEDANRYIPLFAKSANANMQFKHLSGLLHFKITGKGKLAYATLYGNNGEVFYDEYTLKYTSDDIALKPYENATSRDHIGSRPIGDVVLSDKYNTHIYFMLPAGMTFEKGFKLVIGYVDGDDVEKVVTKEYSESFIVKRGDVGTFPTITTTGGVIDPTPEPESGWITNFFDLSGKNVSVNHYFSYDKTQLWWEITFLTDNASEDVPNDPIILEMVNEYTGGTPTLEWLNGLKTKDFHGRFHDYSVDPAVIYWNVDESAELNINKNDDGTWYLSIEEMGVYNGDESKPEMPDTYLKFRGNFISDEPTASWNANIDGFVGNAASVSYSVVPNQVDWKLTFESTEGYTAIIDFATNPTSVYHFDLSLIDGLRTSDFTIKLVDNNNYLVYEGPNNDCMLHIDKNADDTRTIYLEGMTVTQTDNYDPETAVDLEDITFKFDGVLDDPFPSSWSLDTQEGSRLGNLHGAYAILDPYIDDKSKVVRWRIRFLTKDWAHGGIMEPFDEILVSWEESFVGDEPVFPESATITDYGLDIMNGGRQSYYYWLATNNDAPLTIYHTEDDTYEILITGLKLVFYNEWTGYRDPDSKAFTANFVFDGVFEDAY